MDGETYEALSRIEAPGLEVHQLPGESTGFGANAMRQVDLIEHSGLDRCIVSDADNVFLAETPELFLLLDQADLVFVGGPDTKWLVVTSLWGFRKNELTVEFARKWMEESAGRDFHDAEGLPLVLMDTAGGDLRVKVLAQPRPESNPDHHLSPYDVQTNVRPFYLSKDPHGLGFREAQMGRAKVVQLGTLRGEGAASVSERLKVLIRRFPGAAQFLPFYATLAKRAAHRMGMTAEEDPLTVLREQLAGRRVLPAREGFAHMLNERGLVGQAALVGVSDSAFRELMTGQWSGKELLSVDGGPPDDIADQSLDFAYLDGPRDYASVKLALEQWFGKVRTGGILAGSSFVDGDFAEGVFGVRTAVNEFFRAQDLRVRTTVLDAPWVAWFVEIGGPSFMWKPPTPA